MPVEVQVKSGGSCTATDCFACSAAVAIAEVLKKDMSGRGNCCYAYLIFGDNLFNSNFSAC